MRDPRRPSRSAGGNRSIPRALAAALRANRLSRSLSHRLDELIRSRAREEVDHRLDEVLTDAVKHVLLHDYVVWGDPDRLHIHETAIVNNALFNVASGTITIGPFACLAHSVSLITGVHDFTKLNRERQLTVPPEGHDIVVEQGAWLSSHVVVLGSVTIGEHAVVVSGSVVRGDVPAHHGCRSAGALRSQNRAELTPRRLSRPPRRSTPREERRSHRCPLRG